ncbi:MAG: biotin--[acetyl-CoA-carboxylase] ligase [Bacteroidia bacterium]|nr:biotin--[acetyl-CoA-carboxylase] ligase [Bacteroidia bacterium]
MRTGFIGRNLIFLPQVDSTNSYAMQLLKNVKPKEGTVVYAGAQTQGRGQRSRVWDSEPGRNITMSVILFPSFLELKNQRFLYQMTALACYDTIAAILDKGQFDIKIKWPNDILVNSKKLCGILIENNLIENKLLSSVIGIGMNVNQKKFEQQPNAVSLSVLTDLDFEANALIRAVCHSLEKYYKLLKEGKTEQLQRRYQSLLFGIDEWREFSVNGKNTVLKVNGTGPTGLLLLEDLEGKRFEADAQDLRWIF